MSFFFRPFCQMIFRWLAASGHSRQRVCFDFRFRAIDAGIVFLLVWVSRNLLSKNSEISPALLMHALVWPGTDVNLPISAGGFSSLRSTLLSRLTPHLNCLTSDLHYSLLTPHSSLAQSSRPSPYSSFLLRLSPSSPKLRRWS